MGEIVFLTPNTKEPFTTSVQQSLKNVQEFKYLWEWGYKHERL